MHYLLTRVTVSPFKGKAFPGLLTDGGGGAKRSPTDPNNSHTYPIIMKLGTVIFYLKKIQKCRNYVIHTLNSADICIFHQKSATFVISRNKDINCILIHNF